MLDETGLDGSVWPDLAGERNPSSNKGHPDGFRPQNGIFLSDFRGGRRPTFREGLGAEPPLLRPIVRLLVSPGQ